MSSRGMDSRDILKTYAAQHTFLVSVQERNWCSKPNPNPLEDDAHGRVSEEFGQAQFNPWRHTLSTTMVGWTYLHCSCVRFRFGLRKPKVSSKGLSQSQHYAGS